MARKSIPEMYVLFERHYRPKDLIKFCSIGRGTAEKAYTRWNKETRINSNKMEQQIIEGKASQKVEK